MSDDLLLDTSLTEPSWTATEGEMMLFSLERSRAQFAWKVGGLDANALQQPFPPSTMTLAGLVKHVALVEDKFTYEFLTGEPYGAPWNAVEGMSVWEWGWRSAVDDTPAELYALWRAAVARSRAAWAQALSTGDLGQPSKLVLDDGSPNLRRAMADLTDEYARHVGHADLLREAVDGLVGEDPP
jgi:Protein of unknown function (DUF664)